jgi:hypothetical protein
MQLENLEACLGAYTLVLQSARLARAQTENEDHQPSQYFQRGGLKK